MGSSRFSLNSSIKHKSIHESKLHKDKMILAERRLCNLKVPARPASLSAAGGMTPCLVRGGEELVAQAHHSAAWRHTLPGSIYIYKVLI